MKQTLLFTKVMLVFICIALAMPSQAQDSQTVPELIFKNPMPESGTAGADGAVYRFPDVAPNIDALVKIAGRSSTDVVISNIDLNNTGYDNAFQPQISYKNGNAPANSDWWLDFDFNFVIKNTTTPVNVAAFNITGLDIDGDGGTLHEYVSFMSPSSYTLEANSSLTVENILDLILNILTPGKKFNGPTTNYTNINTTATAVMTTIHYLNRNFFRMRAGGATGNSSTSAADRMYSFWFKGFTYNTPVVITLPVKLRSFDAYLKADNKVDLKWTTASEINVSHFVVERSTDGINYSDAGLVFAYGNSTVDKDYVLTDNLANTKSDIVYYRLRSVDIDGKSQYSEVRIIRINTKSENSLTILTYPNPVTSELRITLPANWQNKKVVYELFKANGQIAKRAENTNSSQTETMNVSQLAPGFYIVRVICNGEMAQQKIIKQ